MKQGLRAVAVVALLGLYPATAATTVWNARLGYAALRHSPRRAGVV
jgi:hypothetical protein